MKTRVYFYLFAMLLIYTFSSCNNNDEPMSSDPIQSKSSTTIIKETSSGIVIKEVLKSIKHNGTIVGQVRFENGDPFTGVFVSVKGTTTGTTTDLDGNYSIQVPNSGILVFYFPGYETVEVDFNINTGSIIVYMKPSET